MLQSEYSSQVSSARGFGLFCAIDARDTAHQDKLCIALRRKGLVSYLLIFCFHFAVIFCFS